MDEILVSIIVPIYNVEQYLDRCLLSIKEQTYRNIEVIMVNDGSSDASRSIAERYGTLDRRFRLVDKENGGLSSARNFGMKYVTGAFVAFVDSEDFLANDYVERLLNAFDEQVDIVIGDYVIYNDTTQKAYLHGLPLNREDFFEVSGKKRLVEALLEGYPVMSVWKNMYRVSFLRRERLEFVSERLIYAEDKLFNIEAYSKARVVRVIPDIVFYHRIVSGSLSQGYRRNKFTMSKELFFRVKEQLENFYDIDFVKQYENTLPEVIGSAMFSLCKCKFSGSIINVETVLRDDFVRQTYKKKMKRTGLLRYTFLYELGRIRVPALVVLAAKLMIFANPIYRFYQQKKEYGKVC